MKADVGRLKTFLGWLPAELPVAFEFRHASWQDHAVREVLAGHGAAEVYSDTEEKDEDPALHVTAQWGYVRLRRPAYDAAALDGWVRRLESIDWRRTFVFFKHEDAGAGPRLAESFMERARS